MLLQCSSQLPPGHGLESAPGSIQGTAPSGQENGIFKVMMLLSPPLLGHCRQWEQTGNQILGKGSWRLGLTLRSTVKGKQQGKNDTG